MATAPAAAEGAEAAPLQRPGRLTALAPAVAAGARAGPRAAGRGSKWQPLPAASIRGCTAPGHCGKLRASTPPPRPIRGHLSPPALSLPRPVGALQPPPPPPRRPFPKSGAKARAELELCLEGAEGFKRGGGGDAGDPHWASGKERPEKVGGKNAAPWSMHEGRGTGTREGLYAGSCPMNLWTVASTLLPVPWCQMPEAAFSSSRFSGV
jgi:hypothetical protein